MPKFTFVCEEEPMPFVASVITKRTVEIKADTLNDVLCEFENFLRGCGYHFEGQLDFVYEETEPPNNEPINESCFSEIDNSYNCPVCKLDMNIMRDHNCYDKNCPKVN